MFAYESILFLFFIFYSISINCLYAILGLFKIKKSFFKEFYLNKQYYYVVFLIKVLLLFYMCIDL